MGVIKNISPIGGAVAKASGSALSSVTGISEFKRIGEKSDKLQKDPRAQGRSDLRRLQGKYDEEPVAERKLQRPMSTWYRG